MGTSFIQRIRRRHTLNTLYAVVGGGADLRESM